MGASSALIAMQQQYLLKQAEEYRAKLAALDGQRAQKAAERDTVAAMIDKLEATEPIIQQRVDILKSLSDKGLGSKITYLESQQIMMENEKELAVQRVDLWRRRRLWRPLTKTELKWWRSFTVSYSRSLRRRNAKPPD